MTRNPGEVTDADMIMSSEYRKLTCFVTCLTLLVPLLAEELEYCPFFDNRGTSYQPFLRNCTWYQKSACCQQVEIDYAFGNVKPPQGASKECLTQLNYLLCYICDPLQYRYYKKENLTVCEDFCDNLYDACGEAILKGSVIRDSYRNGAEFCQSRQFHVEKSLTKKKNNSCFYWGDDKMSSQSNIRDPSVVSLGLLLLAIVRSVSLA